MTGHVTQQIFRWSSVYLGKQNMQEWQAKEVNGSMLTRADVGDNGVSEFPTLNSVGQYFPEKRRFSYSTSSTWNNRENFLKQIQQLHIGLWISQGVPQTRQNSVNCVSRNWMQMAAVGGVVIPDTSGQPSSVISMQKRRTDGNSGKALNVIVGIFMGSVSSRWSPTQITSSLFHIHLLIIIINQILICLQYKITQGWFHTDMKSRAKVSRVSLFAALILNTMDGHR